MRSVRHRCRLERCAVTDTLIARPAGPGGSLQPIVAGVLAAVVGYASTFTLVLSGLGHAGATPAQAASGLFATTLLLGLLNVVVAWRLKIPLSFAWSTPGVAFLLTIAAPEGGYPVVVGAFIVTGLLIVLAGLIKPFARLVAAIPAPIASAMLAGVLLNLCLAPLHAVQELPGLTVPVILVWALGLRFARRYAVPLAVAAAVIGLAVTAQGGAAGVAITLPVPQFIAPAFSLDGMVRIALPLFVITMASQNLPGLAVMRANGFTVTPAPIFVLTGLASVIAALFGGHTINLAAITAAIAAGPESHPDPARRWTAPIAAGMTYAMLALLAAMAAAFIAVSPPVLIEAVAGLALLTSLASALGGALAVESDRLPAIVTFVTAASGITIAGIGGAFWGLVAGIVLTVLLGRGARGSGG
jgi:benzoate membrane transport protein